LVISFSLYILTLQKNVGNQGSPTTPPYEKIGTHYWLQYGEPPIIIRREKIKILHITKKIDDLSINSENELSNNETKNAKQIPTRLMRNS